MPTSIRDTLRFRGSLADHDSSDKPQNKRRKKLSGDVPADSLESLQERLWAESTAGGRRAILLLLQGIDTSGKGGVTNHVVGVCKPIGVQYTAFKKPTDEELRHDFLWRIRPHVPRPGVIGVFDRSHYEDVIVPLVHDLLPAAEIDERYRQIAEFEASLVASEVTVVKCFLHISNEVQRERLLARLDKPDKHWKFQEPDIDERELWPRYQEAFDAMLKRTSIADAPWYVVPGDSKKYRNWAVAEILLETLRDLDPQYPRPDLDIPALRARLDA